MSLSHFPNWESLDQLKNLATPVWVFDVDRHQLWWANPAAIDFWEASSLEDVVQRDFSNDSDIVRTRLRQVFHDSDGDARLQDTWTLYPHDRPRTVVLSMQPIRIEDSTDALLIEIKRFVEPQADDDAIRMMEAARVSTLMVSTFSTQGELLVQNPAALSCYGPFIESALRARLQCEAAVETVLATVRENRQISIEHDVQTLTGTQTHCINAGRGRDPITGDFVLVLSEENVTEQVTLRRKLQDLNARLEAVVTERTQKLRQSEERYALATQTAAIWDWHIADDKVFISPSFVSALGYNQRDFDDVLFSEGLFGFVHPDDAGTFREAVRLHLMNNKTPMNKELRFLKANGETTWYHVQGQTVSNQCGRPKRSVGLLTDISQRKELEVSLLAAQRLEAIGQLTGGIAHDFNNLLTVIQGNAQLLELGDHVDHELTEAIRSSAARGAELTRHLLAYSRKQSLRPETIDISLLVQRIQKTLLRTLGEQFGIETRIAPNLWPIFADPTQVESAILNLAINARDAMKGGGKIILDSRNWNFVPGETDMALDFEKSKGAFVELAIRDTGVGMSKEQLARAFEPFFTTKDVGEGSGLGLSMVFGFSRQSGGDVLIESEPGKGTKVSLFLPRAPQEVVTQTSKLTQEPVRGKGEHIHVIEDDLHVQSTMTRLLSAMNYIVTRSSDAHQAMQFLKNGTKPDLVLADIILPDDFSGIEFADRIRADCPDLPVILMSGHPERTHTSKCRPDGDWHFLQKPIESSTLAQAIHDAIHG